MIFIILMGAPGAGKGTQARLLQEATNLPQVSTGDLFRENLSKNSELGQLAKSYMDEGNLVPDEVTVAMVQDRLSRPDCANGAILDGFPRSPTQAEALEVMLNEMEESVDIVPHINVDPEELVARLLNRAITEGRADDNEETIRTRMKVYHEKTAPLIEFYEKAGLLVHINGQQSVDDVYSDLVSAVQSAAPSLNIQTIN